MSGRRALGVAVVTCCVLGAAATPATAVIPQNNLLRNPGAEEGPDARDGSERFDPRGWAVSGNASATATAVRYSTTGFPTTTIATAIGGGNIFFAGGPGGPREIDFASVLTQELSLAEASTEIDAGSVQATSSGCLGGNGTQEDNATIRYLFKDGAGNLTANRQLAGPQAAERGNVTALLPRSDTIPVAPGTRTVTFEVRFLKLTNGFYNDGYADNLSFRLSPRGSAPPPPDCPPPQTAPPGPGPTPPGPGPGPGPGPQIRRVPLDLTGSLRLTRRALSLRLLCTAGAGERCVGRLSLSTRGIPGRRVRVFLGSKRFDISGGQSRRVAVGLRRSVRRSLAALSRRQLRRLRVKVSAVVEGEQKDFVVGVRRKR
jgi:hypothetical protein